MLYTATTTRTGSSLSLSHTLSLSRFNPFHTVVIVKFVQWHVTPHALPFPQSAGPAQSRVVRDFRLHDDGKRTRRVAMRF